jgi:hypothetical protein
LNGAKTGEHGELERADAIWALDHVQTFRFAQWTTNTLTAARDREPSRARTSVLRPGASPAVRVRR